MMKAKLIRLVQEKKQTLSEILFYDDVNLKLSVKALELPDRNNQHSISRIPAGKYMCVRRWSEKYGWHYILKDVPNRDFILIHFGNYYTDYRGNCGDNIHFTDNRGYIYENEKYPSYWRWHEMCDDRGIMSIKAITSDRGGLKLFEDFLQKCREYIKASNDLKEFYNTENAIQLTKDDVSEDFYNEFKNKYDSFYFTVNRRNMYFEQTTWFSRFKNIAKAETIKKKRDEFNAQKEYYNKRVRDELFNIKKRKAEWFEANGISVRNAYLFIQRLKAM